MEEKADFKTVIAIPMKYEKGDHPTLDKLVCKGIAYGKSKELLEKIMKVALDKEKPHFQNYKGERDVGGIRNRYSRKDKKRN